MRFPPVEDAAPEDSGPPQRVTSEGTDVGALAASEGPGESEKSGAAEVVAVPEEAGAV